MQKIYVNTKESFRVNNYIFKIEIDGYTSNGYEVNFKYKNIDNENKYICYGTDDCIDTYKAYNLYNHIKMECVLFEKESDSDIQIFIEHIKSILEKTHNK